MFICTHFILQCTIYHCTHVLAIQMCSFVMPIKHTRIEKERERGVCVWESSILKQQQQREKGTCSSLDSCSPAGMRSSGIYTFMAIYGCWLPPSFSLSTVSKPVETRDCSSILSPLALPHLLCQYGIESE